MMYRARSSVTCTLGDGRGRERDTPELHGLPIHGRLLGFNIPFALGRRITLRQCIAREWGAGLDRIQLQTASS